MGAGHAIALGIWGRVLFYAWRSKGSALFSMPFPFPGSALNCSDNDMRYQIPQEYDNPECEIIHGPSLAFWPGDTQNALDFLPCRPYSSLRRRLFRQGANRSGSGMDRGGFLFSEGINPCRSHIPVIDLQGRGAVFCCQVWKYKAIGLYAVYGAF